jgi:hypothetical protein
LRQREEKLQKREKFKKLKPLKSSEVYNIENRKVNINPKLTKIGEELKGYES